jgi:hypothetical protein
MVVRSRFTLFFLHSISVARTAALSLYVAIESAVMKIPEIMKLNFESGV